MALYFEVVKTIKALIYTKLFRISAWLFNTVHTCRRVCVCVYVFGGWVGRMWREVASILMYNVVSIN